MQGDRIPEELRERPQWVVWRREEVDGKPTKIPYQARVRAKASTTDPATWSSYQDASAAAEAEGVDGLGFVFSTDDPFSGVDFDGCVDGEDVNPHVATLLRTLDSYTELSPSGTGLHTIVRARLNGGPNKTNKTPWAHGFENYDRARFFCFTGRHLRDTPHAVNERQAQLDQVRAAIWPAKEKAKPSSTATLAGADDRELLERAYRAKNGSELQALYAGRHSYGSASEADLALCNRLAFWTGPDPDRIDRLFRSSGLMRPKWDSSRGDTTYGRETIQTALADRTDFYGDHLVQRSTTPAGAAPRTLEQVLETFERWLYLPDLGALLAMLGALAANMLEGDPVWLFLVGPPSGGKSELLGSTTGIPIVHKAATLTEGALLSGTAARDRTAGAKGGLLNVIGEFGVLMLKDFGSVLSMQRDSRAAVLAALREIYDGSWTRHIGTDGGKTLHWQGKLGLLAGCTPTIDRHHAVMGAMGERFLLYRLPIADAERQAAAALENDGRQADMRRELGEAVSGLFADGLPCTPTSPSLEGRDRLIKLSTFVARCRSAVERDSYSREVELVSDPESPARLVLTFGRMLAGLAAIGVEPAEAWRVVTKIALDSMPALRLAAIRTLHASSEEMKTAEVAEAVRHPTITARRALEDLDAHNITVRHRHGQGNADTWTLSDWARDRYVAFGTVSEMSEDSREAGGTVSGMSGKTSEAPKTGAKAAANTPLNYPVSTEEDITETVAAGEQQQLPDDEEQTEVGDDRPLADRAARDYGERS